MVFSDEDKALIDKSSTHKSVIISFPNGERANITNSMIYQEEMSYEESIAEQNLFMFGKCNNSMFKVKTTYFDEDVNGADIEVKIVFSNRTLGKSVEVLLGRFVVGTSEMTADRKYRNIIAYGLMSKFDVDIAEWYNTILYPTTETVVSCKTMLGLLCDYVGVSYNTDYELPFGDLEIAKTMEPTSLIGRGLLEQILQINGVFGYFNELGVLDFIEISENVDDVVNKYIASEYEDSQNNAPDGVAIKLEDDSLGYYVGADEQERTYNVVGNALIYEMSDLGAIGDNLLIESEKLSYKPNKTVIKGGIYHGLGNRYTVNHKMGSFDGVVMSKRIDGIQAMKTTIACYPINYNQDNQNLYNEYIVLKGKTAKIKKDIESLLIEFEDLEKNVSSQLEITAESINTKVSKDSIISEINQSAEEVKIQANKIEIGGESIVLNGNTTVEEDFILTADNIDADNIVTENIRLLEKVYAAYYDTESSPTPIYREGEAISVFRAIYASMLYIGGVDDNLNIITTRSEGSTGLQPALVFESITQYLKTIYAQMIRASGDIYTSGFLNAQKGLYAGGNSIIDGKLKTKALMLTEDSQIADGNNYAVTGQKIYDELFYKPGDTITGFWYGGGFVTSSRKHLRFTIPLDKPVIGVTSITATTTMSVRQNGKYIFGDTSTGNVVSTEGLTLSYSFRPSGLNMQFASEEAYPDSINNDAVGVTINYTITFN